MASVRSCLKLPPHLTKSISLVALKMNMLQTQLDRLVIPLRYLRRNQNSTQAAFSRGDKVLPWGPSQHSAIAIWALQPSPSGCSLQRALSAWPPQGNCAASRRAVMAASPSWCPARGEALNSTSAAAATTAHSVAVRPPGWWQKHGKQLPSAEPRQDQPLSAVGSCKNF